MNSLWTTVPATTLKIEGAASSAPAEAVPEQVPEDNGQVPFEPVPRRRRTRGGGDTCRKQLGCQENSGKNIVTDPLIRIHLIFSKILMFLPAVKMEEVCIPRQIGVFPGVHLRMCFGNCGSACLISSYPTVCTRNFPSRLAWSKNEI